jgi:lysozyme
MYYGHRNVPFFYGNFMDDLKKVLIQHEGMKLLPYDDTLGILTIGVGRNLKSRGISKDEAMIMLENDIKRCDLELLQFDWYKELDTVRREALIELVFNMGLTRLLSFNIMINALKLKKYVVASKELLNSKWAQQVKQERANNIARRIETGKY